MAVGFLIERRDGTNGATVEVDVDRIGAEVQLYVAHTHGGAAVRLTPTEARVVARRLLAVVEAIER